MKNLIEETHTSENEQGVDLELRNVKRLGELRLFAGQRLLDLRALDDLRLDLSRNLDVRLEFSVHLKSMRLRSRNLQRERERRN